MKQATAIRLCLLGLPIGLVLTTAVSLTWHFTRKQEAGAPSVFTQLAEEISEASLIPLAENLSEVIGKRHASLPGTLERASNYLESTLGPRNMGYQVARQEFQVDGQMTSNLWVELLGGKRRNECIVLVAHYDAPPSHSGKNDNASGVAALLALAENFVREKPMLTLRMAFLANGTPPHAGTENSGAYHFAELLKRQGDQVKAVFCLDGLGAFPASPTDAPPSVRALLPSSGPFLTLLGLENAVGVIKEAAAPLSESLPFTVHQGVVLPESAGFFAAHDTQPFQEAGYATVLTGGSGVFATEDLPVDGKRLTEVTRSLATLARILTNPSVD